MSAGDLLRFFHDAWALNELKNFPVVCGRMLLLNMRVEVGAGTRLVFASGACQLFGALGRTAFERRLGLGGERYQDGHTPE
jgi:hypothetical protein